MIEDLIGKRFDRWTVEVRADNTSSGAAAWRCVCDCGNDRVIPHSNLIRGKSKSCGCLQKELARKRLTRHGFTARGARRSEFNIWMSMRARCENANHVNFKDYGGRGIAVCSRWQIFDNFLADMGNRPPNATIDRIKNNLGYEPGNCQWATRKQQGFNKRNNRMLIYDGRTQTLTAWAEEFGIKPSTLWARLNLSWSIEQALTIKVGCKSGA